jgi:hypothetical protein
VRDPCTSLRSQAALPHKRPTSAGAFHESCLPQGHDKGDIVCFARIFIFEECFEMQPTTTLDFYRPNLKLTVRRTGVSAVLSFITLLPNLGSAIRLYVDWKKLIRRCVIVMRYITLCYLRHSSALFTNCSNIWKVCTFHHSEFVCFVWNSEQTALPSL